MHTRFSGFSFLLLCAVLLTTAQPARELSYASRVSSNRLQQMVRDLVALGNRQGGTRSGDRAAAYIERQFRSFGIEADVIADPERLAWTNESWTLQVQEPRRLRGLIQHEALAGYSPDAPNQVCRLVAITGEDDISDKRMDSAVALVHVPVTAQLYAALVDAHAAALIAYDPSPENMYAQWAMVTSLSPSEKNPVPLFTIPASAGRRLTEELQSGITVRIRFAARTTIQPGRPKTVIGKIDGTSNKYVIVCAHGDSDSGGPGADDNASGVAGVMEIARVWTDLLREGRLPRPKMGIHFVVWGSEYHSSEAFVKRCEDSLSQIAAVVNFDEIGFGKSRDCIYFEGNDIAANESLLRLFDSLGVYYAGKGGFWKEATTNPSQGGTDSYVFLPSSLRRLDIPVVTIPSVTVFSAAWNTPKTMAQTPGWHSQAWKGDPDSVTIDFSPYYHSTMDIPRWTTEKEPFNMAWGVKAVGIALIRLMR